MAKIPHRPEPEVRTDYNTVLKRDISVQNKTEESALFKNAIKLADERNQNRATHALVRGGEEAVNDRASQLSEGRGDALNKNSANQSSMMRSEVRNLSEQRADTKAAKDAASEVLEQQPNALEQGLDEAELKTKKHTDSTTDNNNPAINDAQVAQLNAANAEQATPLPGMFMSEAPKHASHDMGRFESVQAAVKFLDSVNTDTSATAWRFSLPGEEYVTGVHMERDKSGGWSITVAADEEHTDSLNQQLDNLVTALEDSGLRVSNVGLS